MAYVMQTCRQLEWASRLRPIGYMAVTIIPSFGPSTYIIFMSC